MKLEFSIKYVDPIIVKWIHNGSHRSICAWNICVDKNVGYYATLSGGGPPDNMWKLYKLKKIEIKI